MKRLSDYKNEDAIELWANMLDPILNIFQDDEVRKGVYGAKSALEKAQTILRLHKTDAANLLLTIDPTPITGLNIITRLIDILTEIENSEEFGSFFGSQQQGMTESVSSGSATENTEGVEK